MKNILLKSQLSLLLLILLFPTKGNGQTLRNCDDINFNPAIEKSLHDKESFSPYYYEMPFKIKNRLIIIEAIVNGKKGNFIVDTGIEAIVLNSRGKSRRSVYLNFHDLHGYKLFGELKKIKLEIGHWKYEKLMANQIDISHLENEINIPIMGLIGMKVLRDFELHFDYRQTKLIFYQLDKQGNKMRTPLNESPPIDSIPVMFTNNMPYIKAQIGEKTYRLGLDSGASINIFTAKTPRPFKGQATSKTAKIINLGFTERTQNTKLLRLPIRIGSQQMLPMPFILKDYKNSPYTCLKEKRLHGLLGYYFLSQQKTALNFRKKQLFLWERQAAQKPINKKNTNTPQNVL